MSLSNEHIIYELTRIKINLGCYQEHMADSCKNIDKLISYLKPSMKKRKREEEDMNCDKLSSLNSSKFEIRNNTSFSSEVGDIVATINGNHSRRENTNKLMKINTKEDELLNLHQTESITKMNNSRECFPHLFYEKFENIKENNDNKRRRIGRNLDTKEKNCKSALQVLCENKSFENLQKSPIDITNTNILNSYNDHAARDDNNQPAKGILARFNSAVKRMKRNTNSALKDGKEQEDKIIHSRTDNKYTNSHNQLSPSHPNMDKFFSPKDFFEKQNRSNKSSIKDRLSSLGNIDLSYFQSKKIKIKKIERIMLSEINPRPHLENVCTIKLNLMFEKEYLYMTGIAYEVFIGMKFSDEYSTSQIIDLKEVSYEYLNNNPEKKYLFIVFENKSEILNYSKMSTYEWEENLRKNFIEKKENSYYLVLLKNQIVYELSAELKNLSNYGQMENKYLTNKEENSVNGNFSNYNIMKPEHNPNNNLSTIKFGIETGPLPNSFTINNNTITNNISSTGAVCMNQNPKEISNIFRDAGGHKHINNTVSDNNMNKTINYGIFASNTNSNCNNNHIMNATQSFGPSYNNNNNIWRPNFNTKNLTNSLCDNRVASSSFFNPIENYTIFPVISHNQNMYSNNNNFLNSTINNDIDIDNNMKWDKNF